MSEPVLAVNKLTCRYQNRRDYALIAFGLLLLATSIVIKAAGMGGLWVPAILIP
jgi:hypothetical protein